MESYASAAQVYAAGLVFARIGAMVMLIPGVGETAVPPRIRLSLSLLLALMLFPVVGAGLPTVPPNMAGVVGAVMKEIITGLMIGTILRLFVSSLAVTGEIVSMQTTLSFAQTTNPMQAAPSTSLGTLLGTMGVLLVMTTDLHHMFFSAIVRSYTLFPVVKPLNTGDAAQLAIQTVGKSFALGLQLSAPVVVFSLVFNIATGLVGRVMPQFQVFFVATPLMVLFGLSIFALSLGVVGTVWVDHYRDLIGVFG